MWHEFDEQEQYLDALVAEVAARLDRATALGNPAGFAVSGGRSPIPMFERLSRADLDWGKVHISLVDERFVAPSHPDSNEYIVRRHLLQHRASTAQFTGLITDAHDLHACLAAANRQNHAIALAILGMGDDGHTASLFPHARQLLNALDRRQPSRYAHITPPAAKYERISMTLAAMLQTGGLILAIAGHDKKSIYEQAAGQPSTTFPISYLIHQTETPFDVYWHP